MATEQRTSYSELAGLFLRLGVTSFGGPVAHIANMHREIVERRKWLTSAEFLDLLGATAATLGVFLPAFFFVAVSHHLSAACASSSLRNGYLTASMSLLRH